MRDPENRAAFAPTRIGYHGLPSCPKRTHVRVLTRTGANTIAPRPIMLVVKFFEAGFRLCQAVGETGDSGLPLWSVLSAWAHVVR